MDCRVTYAQRNSNVAGFHAMVVQIQHAPRCFVEYCAVARQYFAHLALTTSCCLSDVLYALAFIVPVYYFPFDAVHAHSAPHPLFFILHEQRSDCKRGICRSVHQDPIRE